MDDVKGLGVASFLCGVMALALKLMSVMGMISIISGVLGLVFGIISISRHERGLGIWGFIMSLIVVGWVIAANFMADDPATSFDEVGEIMRTATPIY